MTGSLEILDQLSKSVRSDSELNNFDGDIISASVWRKTKGISQQIITKFKQRCKETNIEVPSDV